MEFLRYGNYYQQLIPFIEVFGRENIVILDGSNVGNVETTHLEEQLGLKYELKFEFNNQKGYNCLVQPHQYCLSDAKGRPSTIDKRAKLKKEISILEDYYKPQMQMIFELLFPNLSREEFCENLEVQRFKWLRQGSLLEVEFFLLV